MVRRAVADRVGGRGIAQQSQRLAAAAAEIHLAPLAGAARLLHPARAAKALEGVARVPYLRQPPLPARSKLIARDGIRRVAGQHAAVGGDVDEPAAPAAHAGLGQVGVQIGQHVVDDQLAAQGLAPFRDDGIRAGQRGFVGDQRRAVDQRPAMILHMRHLQPPGTERHGKVDDLVQPVEILPVHHGVQRQRHAELRDRPRRLELLRVRASIGGDAVGDLGIRALDADLHMVQPGLGQGASLASSSSTAEVMRLV